MINFQPRVVTMLPETVFIERQTQKWTEILNAPRDEPVFEDRYIPCIRCESCYGTPLQAVALVTAPGQRHYPEDQELGLCVGHMPSMTTADAEWIIRFRREFAWRGMAEAVDSYYTVLAKNAHDRDAAAGLDAENWRNVITAARQGVHMDDGQRRGLETTAGVVWRLAVSLAWSTDLDAVEAALAELEEVLPVAVDGDGEPLPWELIRAMCSYDVLPEVLPWVPLPIRFCLQH